MPLKGHPSKRFSDSLREACAGEWRAAHEDHAFVRAIGDGTLPLSKFQFFMRQDYLFLIGYCRVLAIAASKCPDLDSMGWWAKLLDETLNSEMALHRSFCVDFGITEKQLEQTRPAEVTIAYTGFLFETARRDSIAVISAALLPCQWGYGEIGRSLARDLKAGSDSFHARWVAGYNAPEYHALTDWLRIFVDRLGKDAPPAEQARMADAFLAGTRHELTFWEQAWHSRSA